jgi:hypothetical protein
VICGSYGILSDFIPVSLQLGSITLDDKFSVKNKLCTLFLGNLLHRPNKTADVTFNLAASVKPCGRQTFD